MQFGKSCTLKDFFFHTAWFVLQNLGMVLSFLVCYLPEHYLLTMFRGMSFLYNILWTFINCGLGGTYTQEMVWGGRGGGRRKAVQVFLNSSHPINKLQPVKGHQPQLCLCIPASSQEVFSQDSGITWRSWTATNTGGWKSVSLTEPRRRFWPYIKF